MAAHTFLKEDKQEKQILTRRSIFGLLFIALMIGVLLSRVAYLQITNHQKYATLSINNQLRLIPISPSRGLIYDRLGRVVARNKPIFQLVLVPERIKNLPEVLQNLAKIIPYPTGQQKVFLDKLKHSPSYLPQNINIKLTEKDVSTFVVNQHLFPEIKLAADLTREYPYGPLLAHILGYVAETSKEDLATLDRHRYAGTFQVGKIGVEKFYENHLHGYPGYQKVETDVLGREVRVLSTMPANPGTDLHLTIDIELQEAASKILGTKKGAVVALDPKTGEILASVSYPAFDPNAFVMGLDDKAYEALTKAPDRPLFNRVIQGQYPPASTIKPLLALGGLATKTVNHRDKVHDPGWYRLHGNGRLYRCWRRKHGHGWVNVDTAIRESCDVYFYDLADRMGIDQVATWYQNAGFGHRSGIDLPGEQEGVAPSPAWKKKALGKSWYTGETLSAGIGQGYALATPLQLAVYGAYMANRGQAYRPHFNKALSPEPMPLPKVEDPVVWDHIIEPMHQVVQDYRGTAFRYFNGLPFEVAGKSGTAQVFGLKQDEKYEADKIPEHLRDHSLFVAFAPVKDPKIVVAVVLEHQKASAAVARKMIETYLTDNYHAEQIPVYSPF